MLEKFALQGGHRGRKRLGGSDSLVPFAMPCHKGLDRLFDLFLQR